MIIEFDDPELASPVDPAPRRSRLVRRFHATVPAKVRRYLSLTLAVAIGLGMGAVGVNRQRDAQAVRQRDGTALLYATIDPSGTTPDQSLRRAIVELANLGPLPIEVESVRLVAAGFAPAEPEVFSDRMILAGHSTPVSVTVGPALCDGEADGAAPPATVTAAVRTADGSSHELRFPLSDLDLQFLHHMDCEVTAGWEGPPFLMPTEEWEPVRIGDRPAIRGTVQVTNGPVQVILIDIDDSETFEIRPRIELPFAVAANATVEVPVDIVAKECNLTMTQERASFNVRLLLEDANDSSQGAELVTVLDAYNTSASTLLALDDLLERSCPAAP